MSERSGPKKADKDTTTSSDQPPANTPNNDTEPPEFGGQKGPEPTRYGDWEKDGIISDF